MGVGSARRRRAPAPTRRARAWVGSGVATALIYVMRNNQVIAVGDDHRRDRRRPLEATTNGLLTIVAATRWGSLLLPAVHNLAYGNRLGLSTTSNALGTGSSFSDLGQVFSGSAVGEEIRGHFSAILYNPPTPGLAQGSLAWLLWSLLASACGDSRLAAAIAPGNVVAARLVAPPPADRLSGPAHRLPG